MTEAALDENKQSVRTLYEECINHGRLEAVDDLIAGDFAGPTGERGPAGFRATVESLRRGFPDIRFTLEDLIAEDDRVTVRWSWQGTHGGPMRGFAPTGRKVTNDGIAIYRFQDGRIVQSWLQADRLSVLQQIGVVATEPERLVQADAR